MKRLFLVFCILAVSGCSTVSSIPTSTSGVPGQTPQNPAVTAETSMLLTYPSCASSPIDQLPTPTPPLPDQPPQKLSQELTIEEYHSYVYHIHTQDGGCKYANRKFIEKTINLNSSYQITIQSIDMNSELVKVSKAGLDVYEVKTLTYGSSGLLQAWSYDDHWIIEIKTDKGVDIIRDGQSLKEINGYDKVFAYQFLAGKPFYFFRKASVWGVNYNDHEFPLDYDDIPYTNVSDGMDPSVLQYQNMVLFQAKKGSENYSVVIGVFH